MQINFINIDLILIILFLILNLGLGLWYGKGIKSMKDFVLGGRNFSTGALTATVIATWISGSAFSIFLSESYMYGIVKILSYIGMALGLIITGCILPYRMQEFLGKISIADVASSLYGKKFGHITAISSILVSTGFIAAQVKVFSFIFNYFFNIGTIYATIISSLVIITYSAFGGVRAVILTDVFQALTIGAFIPVLLVITWQLARYDNFGIVITDIKNTTFKSMSPQEILLFVSIFLFGLIPTPNPAMFHRMLIAKDVQQMQKSFVLAGLIFIIFIIFVSIIGLILHTVDPNLNPNTLAMYIVDKYSFTGLKGLIVIGIMAMLMSTADSHINTAASIFVNDLCRPSKLFANNQRLQLKAARIFSMIIGIAGMCMALYAETLLQLVYFIQNFFMPTVAIPILMAIIGFRSSTRAVACGMLAGTITVVLWRGTYLQEFTKIDSVIPATFAHLFVLMLAHYILREPGGWIDPKDRIPLDSIQAQPKQHNTAILHFCLRIPKYFTWKNILAYCNDDTYHGKRHYVTYIVFTTIYLLLMALAGDNGYIDKQSVGIINAVIIIFSLGINTLLLYIKVVPVNTRSIFEEFSKKYIGFIWHVAIFCSLVLSSTMLALVGGFNTVLTVCFITNLVLVGLLLRWHTALLMILTGVPLATSVFGLIVRYSSLIVDADLIMNSLQWNIVSSLALTSAITAVIKLRQDQFIEKSQALVKLENKVLGMELTLDTKDQKMEKLLNSKQYIFNNLSNEIKSPMSVAHTTISLLRKFLPKYYQTNLVFKKKKEVMNMLNLAHSSIKQLVSYSNNLFDLSQFEKRQMVFNIELHNLELLIKGVIDECNKIYDNSTCIITLNYHSGAETFFELDYLRMRQVILNLLTNAMQYSPSGVIEVQVIPYSHGVHIIVEDQGVGIPDAELEKIFEPFEESSYTKSQANGKGLGLAVAREIILHHHGTITASNRTNRQGSKFTVQLPVRQPQGNFNNGMHSKNKIFGNPQTYEQRMKDILEEKPAPQQKVNTVQSLSDIEDQVRTNKSIMIIDDDQSFLDATSLNIYTEHYKSTPVNNPFEAIKLVRENPKFYSMVILDMSMPGKTGDKTLQAISDVTGMYSIPVIIVSGYEVPYDTRILLYSLGAAAIITKPCNKEDIHDLIDCYLRPSTTTLFTSFNSNKCTNV